MPLIWILADDPLAPETLTPHLLPLGQVRAGAPSWAAFRDAPPPDLLVLIGSSGGDETEDSARAIERWMGFLRAEARHRRPRPPLVYLEPADPRVPFALVRALVDDRPVSRLEWPPDPESLSVEIARLLAGRALPAGLRERARREWVAEQVERLYADLDLPALRRAIDPRNAARPVLLIGEPGTRLGLLAQYVHDLAEPSREALIVLNTSGLAVGQAGRTLLEASAGRFVTVALVGLDEAGPGTRVELEHLLGESGLLGVESLRWIATARPRRLSGALRDLPWIEVELPPLRRRVDLPRLARELAAERARLAGRPIELSPEAIERLGLYAWPGNLRELERVLDRSLQSSAGELLNAAELRFALAPAEHPSPSPPPREGGSEPRATEEAAPTPEPAARPAAPPPRLRAETVPTFEPAPRPEAPAEETHAESASMLSAAIRELKAPLLALRTRVHLLAQRTSTIGGAEPGASVDAELAELEATLRRLEAFAGFGPPRLESVDVAACAREELERRQARLIDRRVVVLRELDADAPRAKADPEQLRFAIGALLDRALRMVPEGGDLYLASRRRSGQRGEPGGHRLMIRFHSPEDVLGGPQDLPGTAVHLEVMLARALIERMGGEFVADTSGSQDNVILIELPF